MATRRTISLSAVDVDIFDHVADRAHFCDELGRLIADALMGGVTARTEAVAAIFDIEVRETTDDTTSSRRDQDRDPA